jgi:hypothetical protein
MKNKLLLMFSVVFLSILAPTMVARAENMEDYVGQVIDGSGFSTDTEVIDTYYTRVRGTYLMSGTARLTNQGNGKILVTGITLAYQSVNTIYANIMYDKMVDGSWIYQGTCYFSASSTSSVDKSEERSVSRGYYYRARGSHGITYGSVTETCGTKTDGVFVG